MGSGSAINTKYCLVSPGVYCHRMSSERPSAMLGVAGDGRLQAIERPRGVNIANGVN